MAVVGIKYEKDGIANVSYLILLVCKGHWRHKYEKDGMAKVMGGPYFVSL
jgi:hypothetical protein